MMFRHEHILILVGEIQVDQGKRVVARFLDLFISLPAVASEPNIFDLFTSRCLAPGIISGILVSLDV